MSSRLLDASPRTYPRTGETGQPRKLASFSSLATDEVTFEDRQSFAILTAANSA